MANDKQVELAAGDLPPQMWHAAKILQPYRQAVKGCRQVGTPCGAEQVDLASSSLGADGDRPEPAFDAAVALGREVVGGGEVADSDSHGTYSSSEVQVAA